MIVIVSAVYSHANPLKKISPIKMDKQKVLFMHAAPSKAEKETDIDLRVFLAA